MGCRIKKEHYHRFEGITSELWCSGCGVMLTTVWLRCSDNRPLCDDCYWTDPTLRYKADMEDEDPETSP